MKKKNKICTNEKSATAAFEIYKDWIIKKGLMDRDEVPPPCTYFQITLTKEAEGIKRLKNHSLFFPYSLQK